MKTRRLMLVGDPGPAQLGGHLVDAARSLGVAVHLCDVRQAYAGGALRRRLAWWLRGRRPVRLSEFSAMVLDAVRRERPEVLLATGIAPLDEPTLSAIGREGVRRVNFLTDDPWNPAHRARWFLAGLGRYDHVWSPRHANLHDLRRTGVRRVDYLPFGYNPNVHRRQPPATERERQVYDVDLLLAGGADRERVAFLAPVLRAGFRVALYGGYWSRHAATRPYARGFLDVEGLRKATAAARVSLGLVRRANRDGHSMRTYEVPAMGGCLLAERTSDHERLFGRDGEAVLYFESPAEVIDHVRRLLGHPDDRDRLAEAARARIEGGRHTYADRLSVILGAVS